MSELLHLVWSEVADPVDGELGESLSFTFYDAASINTGGGGGGAVDSVNGHVGVVVLAASDVGADAAGAATAAVAAHTAASDPHPQYLTATEGNAAYDAAGAAATALAAALAGSQPVDADLTAIAALTTTAFGRGLLALVDATALRTAAGLGTAATQAATAFDAAGAATTAQAAAVSSANGYTDTAVSGEATARNTAISTAVNALINSAPGTLDTLGEIAAQLATDESAVGALTTSVAGKLAKSANLSDLVDASAARGNLGLGSAATQASSAFDAAGAAAAAQAASQPLDSDLTAIAALTTTSFGRSFLTLADAAAARTLLGLGTAATVNTGTGAANVILGNDSRLTDARTPTAHASTHASAGSDPVSIAASQVTSGVLAIARLATGTPDGTKFVRDDGTLATPAGGSSGATASINGIYGDGNDGNVTISTTVTLTRDMFYDTLTVASGGILKPAGYRIHCKTACTVNSGGTIQYDGNPASGTSAGAGVVTNSVGGSVAGAAGGTGAGASGTSTGTGGLGGRGGSGGSATGAGGNAGSVIAPGSSGGNTAPRSLPALATGSMAGGGSAQTIQGGSGGGAGAGDGTNSGGGGGAGGGVVLVNAKAITNGGTISANGGAGGTPPTGNTGGGGGGGGGVVVVNTSTTLTGTTPTATAGAGGTKSGTGNNGVTGTAGNVYVNVWQ